MPKYIARMAITRVTEYEHEFEADNDDEAYEYLDSLVPDECMEVDETTIEWKTSIDLIDEEELP